MVAIPSAERVQFCIDAYEATVVTEVVDGEVHNTAESKPGVLPTEGISWRAAKAACAATAVQVHGETVGQKHLVTGNEWEDAGDGVLGPGGSPFPWGTDPPKGRCHLPGTRGPARTTPGPMTAAPTGSFPDCRTDSGVYDQVGNAWEWADPERVYHHDPAVAAAQAQGVGFDAGGRLLTVLGTVEAQWSAPVVLGSGTGGVVAQFAPRQGGPPDEVRPTEGWLLLGPNASPAANTERVAIRFIQTGGGEIAVITDPGLDGQPIAEKRGGAYYAGGDVDLRWRSWAHRPDFFGSIGFRCASAPLPR